MEKGSYPSVRMEDELLCWECFFVFFSFFLFCEASHWLTDKQAASVTSITQKNRFQAWPFFLLPSDRYDDVTCVGWQAHLGTVDRYIHQKKKGAFFAAQLCTACVFKAFQSGWQNTPGVHDCFGCFLFCCSSRVDGTLAAIMRLNAFSLASNGHF